MASDLRARLEAHEKNFEGLMALIPADLYYGKDNNSDQWQKKKQTKEEKRAAKKAKLMPGARKSALDVHRENELKRKREDEGEVSQNEDARAEQPEQGSKEGPIEKPAKKVKVTEKEGKSAKSAGMTDEEKRKAKAAKRKEKRQQKKTIREERREKSEAKKARKQAEQQSTSNTSSKSTSNKSSQNKNDKGADPEEESADAAEEDNEDAAELDDMDKIDIEGLADTAPQEKDDEADWSDANSSNSTTDHDSPTFEEQSAASSSSSIQPPTEPEEKPAQPKLTVDTTAASKPTQSSTSQTTNNEEDTKLPKINHASLVSRLESKIAAMRAARQADGLNGKPARTRTELIEARRLKDAKRKQAKKEARAAQRAADEARNAVEEEAARLRGGEGSPLWSIPGLPSSNLSENFSFGSVRFDDGATTNADASELREARKRKGPTDAKTQLSTLEKKEERLSGLDGEKREDIAEKDAWLNARRRIAGEKVKDSPSLLRKTLKRSAKVKAKSEKEWDDRISGVQASKEAKQRRREDNLSKRKEEKNAPRGGKPSPKSAKGKGGAGKERWGIKMNKGKTGPAKKRPGFEGTFKIGSGRR